MKNKIVVLFFIAILILSLTSCSKNNGTHYDISEYCLELEYKEDFKILHLTDIHIANKDDREVQFDYLSSIINDSHADMIVITGDIFTFSTKKVAKDVFNFLDSFNIPWTVTFGNHDEQCYFSIDWLTRYLNNFGSNCLFKDIQDDDIDGNANFAINLMDEEKIVEQLIIMDSNRYNFGEYVGYDYIKESQIEWYENLVNYTKDLNGGSTVKSLLFFHIPLPEIYDAWDGLETGESEIIIGERNEKFCSPDYNSGLFDKILELNSTNGIFVGHDHMNSFVIKYKGIYQGYGVTSTDRIYYKEGLLGGRVITISSDNELSFNDIIRSYDEVK